MSALTDTEFEFYTPLVVQARFCTVEGKGVGRWRNYFRAEGMRDARWCARNLVPACQVRVLQGRDCVLGPMRAHEFVATQEP